MTQIIKCRSCNNEIIIPDFTNDQKKELAEMKRAGLVIQIVQMIQNKVQLGLKNSKALMEHINPIFGQCHRCNYNGLDKENMICPKCKSVNTNWIQKVVI